jgi:hypothetical protein
LVYKILYFSIPLIAGVLTSCAAACAFFAELILALTKGKIFRKDLYESNFVLGLKDRRKSNDSPMISRILA